MFRLRSLIRLSLPALTAFLWRHRDEVIEWAGFGLRAVQAAVPGDDGFDDVKAEARLRYALGRDKRTRGAYGLHVEVRDGIALLHGIVRPEVYEVAPAIAESVEGVRMVDNRLREAGRRGWRPRREVTSD
jgi:hypothetical protein